jgi:HEAT repeat protein
MRSRRVGGAFALGVALVGATALAQPPPSPPPTFRPPASSTPPPDLGTLPSQELRAHFGADIAARLVRSPDPNERLRGLQRAAASKSSEGLTILVRESEVTGAARRDARAMIEVARGLAGFLTEQSAKSALLALVSVPTTATPSRPPGARGATREYSLDESQHAARTEMARAIAAIALASSGDPRAYESLVALARGSGAGQAAAAIGLAVHPPTQPGTLGAIALTTPATVRLAAQIGDLRTLENIRGLVRASDPLLRSAAFLALGELGDMRAIEPATAAVTDRDPRVRAAAVEALVLLGGAERAKHIETLIGDDATADIGVRLAERTFSLGIVKALAARAIATGDASLRAAAIVALGRSPLPAAVQALVELMKNGALHSDVASAIARSPAPNAMTAIEAMAVAAPAATKRLGVRAYVVRFLARGAKSDRMEELASRLAASSDAQDRGVGVGALVALGRRALDEALADKDARVRRAAAVASLVDPRPATFATLLARLATEKDDATREVLAIGMLDGDPDGRVPTLTLVERTESAAADAPLAVLALARRGDDAYAAKVEALLVSRDPIVRAHAARGLAIGTYKDAIGRIAAALAYEADVGVRRVMVRALASRAGDAAAPARVEALRAAALDPDGVVRAVAARALAGGAIGARGASDVAWLHLATSDGGAPPPSMTGALYRADGLAVPIAFDDEGFAIVPGSPPGEARLVLAPRVPTYDAPKAE